MSRRKLYNGFVARFMYISSVHTRFCFFPMVFR